MFITIDGPDGVGKTSVAMELIEAINREAGRELALYTAEPTQSSLGKKIRRILQSGEPEEQRRLTEYFVQNRGEHVEEIAGQIRSGHIVVCDRYRYSTVVYQHMQGEDISKLVELNQDFLRPDYSFILNVKSVDVLLSHIAIRKNAAELFESEEILQRAIALYNQMEAYFPGDNIVFMDADQPVSEMAAAIRKRINR
ncbi:MAG: dTMP kinase [Clostridium sp.]|nr:dTMP kinase [Clostridium sp.]